MATGIPLRPSVLALSLLPAVASGLPSGPSDDDLETDEVVLKDGKTLTGHVVYEDDERLVLRNGSKDREYEMAEVGEVTSRARAIRTLVREMDSYDPWRASDNEVLARRATELGLEAEARILWWRVLAEDPGNEAAHEALGHKKSGKTWRIEHAGRKVRMDKVRDLAEDFGKAWEFPTSHFELRSNLPLEQALDLALDLERLYVEFFRLFGKELMLYETEDPMRVQVHADAASFPERAGERGYFNPGSKLMIADASGGLTMYLIVHEMTHQLVYFTAVEERAHKGAVPSWVNEGLAEYMAGAYKGVPGRLAIDTEQRRRDSFGVHASAKKPLSLSRVINLGGGDFNASTGQALKYAQVYTLLHFCLHGQDGGYRESFMGFLRGAYDGRGSSTDFKRALDLKRNKDFEEEWLEYVVGMTG